MTSRAIAAAAALWAAFFAPASMAQTPCMDLGQAAERLERAHGEVPTWRGVSVRGYAIVLFESAEKGTWTIVMVRGDGLACPLDAGAGAQKLSRSKPS
jgi:hypothetical protein